MTLEHELTPLDIPEDNDGKTYLPVKVVDELFENIDWTDHGKHDEFNIESQISRAVEVSYQGIRLKMTESKLDFGHRVIHLLRLRDVDADEDFRGYRHNPETDRFDEYYK